LGVCFFLEVGRPRQRRSCDSSRPSFFFPAGQQVGWPPPLPAHMDPVRITPSDFFPIENGLLSRRLALSFLFQTKNPLFFCACVKTRAAFFFFFPAARLVVFSSAPPRVYFFFFVWPALRRFFFDRGRSYFFFPRERLIF